MTTAVEGLSMAFRYIRDNDELQVMIEAMMANGVLKLLAEPNVVAASGQDASFLAGGEIPIPVPQGLGSVAVEFKPFGIGLTVTPTILANDRIVLKVAPEASDLDYNNALQLNGTLVPAIITRRADTTVELGDNETFVIGGLVNSTTRSNIDKVPLLGDLPVLGAFFRSESRERRRTNLIVFLRPIVMRDAESASRFSIDRYEQIRGYFYPFQFVIKDNGKGYTTNAQRIVSAPEELKEFEGKAIKIVSKRITDYEWLLML